MRNSILYRTTLSIGVFSLVVNSASAQLATYDAAVHRQTQQVTQHTSEILKSSSEIQKQTEAILKAVSGTRGDAQSIANAALGGSFNFGQAPSFSDVLGGGAMNWGQLNGDIQKTASALINGLRLVKSLSGKENMANNSSTQAAYESAIGLTTSLVGIVSGSQTAVTASSRILLARSAKPKTSKAPLISTPRCSCKRRKPPMRPLVLLPPSVPLSKAD